MITKNKVVRHSQIQGKIVGYSHVYKNESILILEITRKRVATVKQSRNYNK